MSTENTFVFFTVQECAFFPTTLIKPIPFQCDISIFIVHNAEYILYQFNFRWKMLKWRNIKCDFNITHLKSRFELILSKNFFGVWTHIFSSIVFCKTVLIFFTFDCITSCYVIQFCDLVFNNTTLLFNTYNYEINIFLCSLFFWLATVFARSFRFPPGYF